MLTRFGNALEALAMPGKNLDPQFFFKLDDGLGNAGLGGVQRFRRFGQIQVASYGFLDKTKLVEVHIKSRLIDDFIMPAAR